MALPFVKSLADCADYHRTVSPYIPQLKDLAQQIVQTIPNVQGLGVLYVSTNPLITAYALALFLGPVFLLVAEFNRNYSQVDRMWSILPTLYNAHYALYAYAVGLPMDRLRLLLAVSVFWSCRLTFNYWRKGGYTIGSEDYRWMIIKEKIGQPWFFLLDLTFISTIQSLLLCTVTSPTYILLLTLRLTSGGLTPTDVAFGAGIVGLVMTSAIADQQQWTYQNAKKAYRESAKVPAGFKRDDLDRGFNTSGLWKYSRHPNFAAEQSIWVALYLWACQTTQTYYNWTIIAPFSYLLLFQGSTWFTEWITAGKYPEYAEYQKQVGMFVPGFGSWRGSSVDAKIASLEKKKTK